MGGMTKAADNVLAELRDFLNEACITHALAMHGLSLVEEWWQKAPIFPDNPDPLFALASTEEPPDNPSDTYARVRRSRLLELVDRDSGAARETLDHQWVVSLYTAWEHHFRPNLAKAHGCHPDDVKHPLLGDLRRLRNDVVHHGGVVSPGNTGGCEVLRWFAKDDRIRLKAEHFQEFMDLFPWEPLRNGP